jgi:hypothetical protein
LTVQCSCTDLPGMSLKMSLTWVLIWKLLNLRDYVRWWGSQTIDILTPLQAWLEALCISQGFALPSEGFALCYCYASAGADIQTFRQFHMHSGA